MVGCGLALCRKGKAKLGDARGAAQQRGGEELDWSVKEWCRVVPFGEGEARWGISWLWQSKVRQRCSPARQRQRNVRYGAEKAMYSKDEQRSGIARFCYVRERLRFAMLGIVPSGKGSAQS